MKCSIKQMNHPWIGSWISSIVNLLMLVIVCCGLYVGVVLATKTNEIFPSGILHNILVPASAFTPIAVGMYMSLVLNYLIDQKINKKITKNKTLQQ
jgi:hypothetical protein